MNATKVQKDNAVLLDKTLNRILKDGGEPVFDAAGNVVLDAKGKVVRRPPNAATLNVVRGRIKDLGINSVPVEGSASGDLVAEAARRGLKINGRPITMPKLSEDDDAATRTG